MAAAARLAFGLKFLNVSQNNNAAASTQQKPQPPTPCAPFGTQSASSSPNSCDPPQPRRPPAAVGLTQAPGAFEGRPCNSLPSAISSGVVSQPAPAGHESDCVQPTCPPPAIQTPLPNMTTECMPCPPLGSKPPTGSPASTTSKNPLLQLVPSVPCPLAQAGVDSRSPQSKVVPATQAARQSIPGISCRRQLAPRGTEPTHVAVDLPVPTFPSRKEVPLDDEAPATTVPGSPRLEATLSPVVHSTSSRVNSPPSDYPQAAESQLSPLGAPVRLPPSPSSLAPPAGEAPVKAAALVTTQGTSPPLLPGRSPAGVEHTGGNSGGKLFSSPKPLKHVPVRGVCAPRRCVHTHKFEGLALPQTAQNEPVKAPPATQDLPSQAFTPEARSHPCSCAVCQPRSQGCVCCGQLQPANDLQLSTGARCEPAPSSLETTQAPRVSASSPSEAQGQTKPTTLFPVTSIGSVPPLKQVPVHIAGLPFPCNMCDTPMCTERGTNQICASSSHG